MKKAILERINKLEKMGLGLDNDDVVRHSEHHNKWQRAYSDEAYQIYQSLGVESLRLYHCGSSAVADLLAKPIIDIIGKIDDLKELDRNIRKLEKIGYQSMGEYGISGRRFFILYNKDRSKSYVHLHLYDHKSHEIEKHISFRNILCENKNYAVRYETHKKNLNMPRSEYSKAKTDVIRQITLEAKKGLNDQPCSKDKILVVLGAAKGHSKTENFAKNIFRDENTEYIDLNDFGIRPFEYSNNDQKDGFLEIIEKMIKSDRTVLATPVYWYTMSGIMKDFLDRFSDLLDTEYKYLAAKLKNKRIDLLATGSDKELPLGFTTPFNLTSLYFGIDFTNIYYKST